MQGTVSFFILGMDTEEDEIIAFVVLAQLVEEVVTMVTTMEVHSGGELGEHIDSG